MFDFSRMRMPIADCANMDSRPKVGNPCTRNHQSELFRTNATLPLEKGYGVPYHREYALSHVGTEFRTRKISNTFRFDSEADARAET